jgi:hypothetical protein
VLDAAAACRTASTAGGSSTQVVRLHTAALRVEALLAAEHACLRDGAYSGLEHPANAPALHDLQAALAAALHAVEQGGGLDDAARRAARAAALRCSARLVPTLCAAASREPPDAEGRPLISQAFRRAAWLSVQRVLAAGLASSPGVSGSHRFESADADAMAAASLASTMPLLDLVALESARARAASELAFRQAEAAAVAQRAERQRQAQEAALAAGVAALMDDGDGIDADATPVSPPARKRPLARATVVGAASSAYGAGVPAEAFPAPLPPAVFALLCTRVAGGVAGEVVARVRDDGELAPLDEVGAAWDAAALHVAHGALRAASAAWSQRHVAGASPSAQRTAGLCAPLGEIRAATISRSWRCKRELPQLD